MSHLMCVLIDDRVHIGEIVKEDKVYLECACRRRFDLSKIEEVELMGSFKMISSYLQSPPVGDKLPWCRTCALRLSELF